MARDAGQFAGQDAGTDCFWRVRDRPQPGVGGGRAHWPTEFGMGGDRHGVPRTGSGSWAPAASQAGGCGHRAWTTPARAAVARHRSSRARPQPGRAANPRTRRQSLALAVVGRHRRAVIGRLHGLSFAPRPLRRTGRLAASLCARSRPPGVERGHCEATHGHTATPARPTPLARSQPSPDLSCSRQTPSVLPISACMRPTRPRGARRASMPSSRNSTAGRSRAAHARIGPRSFPVPGPPFSPPPPFPLLCCADDASPDDIRSTAHSTGEPERPQAGPPRPKTACAHACRRER